MRNELFTVEGHRERKETELENRTKQTKTQEMRR